MDYRRFLIAVTRWPKEAMIQTHKIGSSVRQFKIILFRFLIRHPPQTRSRRHRHVIPLDIGRPQRRSDCETMSTSCNPGRYVAQITLTRVGEGKQDGRERDELEESGDDAEAGS